MTRFQPSRIETISRTRRSNGDFSFLQRDNRLVHQSQHPQRLTTYKRNLKECCEPSPDMKQCFVNHSNAPFDIREISVHFAIGLTPMEKIAGNLNELALRR
jgi:predicted Zn-dependent protease with MMP-like domain